MTAQRYDVLIYHMDSRNVSAITGRDLPLDTGFHNAEKRKDTVAPRLNADYNTAIVPAGRFAVGDILPEDVE